MNIKEAIEVLKDAKHVGKFVSDYDKRMNEAIDTVVECCEKQLPCDCVIGFEGDIPVTHKLCENCKSKIQEETK